MSARRGDLYTYRVAGDSGDDGRVGIDLGFGITRGEKWAGEIRPERGNVVQSLPAAERERRDGESGEFILARVDGRTVRPYTYRAVVTDVIDGDTVRVVIDHGFHTTTERKLRSRGIDAPELWTRAGAIAKAFVRDVIDAVEFVVVHTRRPDKYGRYLADLYYSIGEKDPVEVAKTGRFLNGEMVRRGMAVKV